jgi:transposase-like protein
MPTKTTKPTLTMAQMERLYATDDACKALLAKMRWPDGKPVCPRPDCGSTKVYKTSQPFRWKCKTCNKNGYRFSVLTGTVFENTNMPLRTWFKVAYLMASSKKGISALQVWRMMDPVRGDKGSYKTAWYMCTRIRAAMKNDEFRKLTGTVEMDETYIGGKAKNRHHKKQLEFRENNKHHPFGGKVGVIGAISRKGNVTARVIEHLGVGTVSRFVRETVSPAVTLVATDQAPVYDRVAWGPLRSHESVNHTEGEYVRGVVHTANLDAFWSLLKRGVIGSYHHVSKKYLPLYVNEFAFRHNNRNNENIFYDLLAGC